MTVNAQYVAEHFNDLASAADSGEQVRIERPGKPTLLLVPQPAEEPLAAGSPRVLGAGIGKMTVPSWQEWQAMDDQLEREYADAPLISTGDI